MHTEEDDMKILKNGEFVEIEQDNPILKMLEQIKEQKKGGDEM